MIIKKHVLQFLLLFVGIISVTGQNIQTEKQFVKSYAQWEGKTRPIRTLVPAQLSDPAKVSESKKKFKAKNIPNFSGRETPARSIPGALPIGEDAVRQSSARSSNSIELEPLVNIEGMQSGAAGFPSPPDPDGAIGKDYYVQMVNATAYRVYDKEGNAISPIISMNTIWNEVGLSSAGDPIVFFDQGYERWVMTEFPPGNFLLVAVSVTSDPLGEWNVYSFATPSFPDYPKYSIWDNAVVVTTNEGGSSGQELYVMNREEMMTGADQITIQRHVLPSIGGSPGFFVATPVDWIGDVPPPADANPMVMRLNDDAWGSSPNDAVEIWEIDIDWDDENNTTLTLESVETAPYDSNPCSVPGPGFSCIPQLNGGGIDGLQEIIMNQVKYRNFGAYEVMVLTFVVDYTGGDNVSGVRWVEMRRYPEQGWEVYQEGTYAPDNDKHRFMSSIAIDASGNIGLAYAISSPDMYPGLAFTGRRAGDPLGEMTVEEYIFAEGLSAAPNARYGDYACMTVDPVDQRTFWFTAEYMRQNSNWGTKILAFSLGRDTLDIGPSELIAPINDPDLGDSEIVQVAVKNNGLDTVSTFDVSYSFEGNAFQTESVDFVLAPDSTYIHTFATTVDMSEIKAYDFVLATALLNDEAVYNDTLRVVREKLPRYDVAVDDVSFDETVICSEEVNASIAFTNIGVETLISAQIDVLLNGLLFETIQWEGNVPSGQSFSQDILLTNLQDGLNQVNISISNPNGNVDENQSNNSFQRNFDVILDGIDVTLNILTDNWPSETTWDILDENGNVLQEGGPYDDQQNLYSETFCFAKNTCYEFIIFDSYGDGLSIPDGYYELVDGEGQVLASIINVNFGSQESNEFCTGGGCALEYSVDVANTSQLGANDGVISIDVSNGVGPFQYSIDGGQNFSENNTFTELAEGDYEVVILDANNCEEITEVEIINCTLVAAAIVQDESAIGANDGEITVNVFGTTGLVEFSIDEGLSWQTTPFFESLTAGDYIVWVRDDSDCLKVLEVTVNSEPSSVKEIYPEAVAEILPNPNDGFFRLTLRGVGDLGLYLDIEVLDNTGRSIGRRKLVRYDDVYTQQINLTDQPSGIYLLRVMHEDISLIKRVIID